MFWRKKSEKTKQETVLEKAQHVASQKREEIGDEALEQIKKAILKRENSALDQAKSTILKADQDKVRDNLNLWLRE